MHTATGEPYRLSVVEVGESGIDVDAGALVSASVRRAVMREQGLTLATGATAHGALAVEIVDIQISLGSFTDPSQRAARYQVVVSLRGRLEDASGFKWVSPAATGYAPFFSTPGPIEALDGAGRRALEQAAEDAGQRLIASLVVVLDRQLEKQAAHAKPSPPQPFAPPGQ